MVTRAKTLAALVIAAILAAITQVQTFDPVERAALSFLVELEGVELREYDDGAGYRTCGVGHVMQPGEVCPKTVEGALKLLADDYTKKSNPVLAATVDSLTIPSTLPSLLSLFTSDAVASTGQQQSNCLMQGYSNLSRTRWRVGTRLEREEGGRWSSGPVWSNVAPKSDKCGTEKKHVLVAKTS